MRRCSWVNLDNFLYIDYHDNEWGIPVYDDRKLFEFLILEMFQAGLSWECILNKRESFRKRFDNFNPDIIKNYDDYKIIELLECKDIVRNRRKIEATVVNARVFLDISDEYGSFSNYIWHFTNNKVIKGESGNPMTRSSLADTISKDLKKRGMKFVGTTIIYSYLQAVGVVNDHEVTCFKYQN